MERRILSEAKYGDPDSKSDDFVHGTDNNGTTPMLIAIADGTSEAIYSGVWAELLVKGFTNDSKAFKDNFEEWHEKLSSNWVERCQKIEIPWYHELKFQQGSFSTFHAVEIPLSENDEIECISYHVGDSCLFLFRHEELVQTIPDIGPKDFNNSPKLISTNRSLLIETEKTPFKARTGDLIILMTDALSQWFLEEYRNHNEENRWRELLEISKSVEISIDADFKAFIRKELDRKRENNENALRNDDVTLFRYPINTPIQTHTAN